MDIDALRNELGAETMADLGRKLGVSTTYLHDLRKGRRGITFRFAAAVDRLRGRDELVPALVEQKTADRAAA